MQQRDRWVFAAVGHERLVDPELCAELGYADPSFTAEKCPNLPLPRRVHRAKKPRRTVGEVPLPPRTGDVDDVKCAHACR